jgi:hypothetical protein
MNKRLKDEIHIKYFSKKHGNAYSGTLGPDTADIELFLDLNNVEYTKHKYDDYYWYYVSMPQIESLLMPTRQIYIPNIGNVLAQEAQKFINDIR